MCELQSGSTPLLEFGASPLPRVPYNRVISDAGRDRIVLIAFTKWLSVCIVHMVIRGLPLRPYPERYFAKTSHGYYVSYQKFDNETKTHRAATLAIFELEKFRTSA
jgi:hypothetical protein